ncbi:hypothetical protein LIA77_08142 [Sarocladium implicatum]|nr:hypothetical protein LIA77_08142 [Sarocladium implicatum]
MRSPARSIPTLDSSAIKWMAAGECHPLSWVGLSIASLSAGFRRCDCVGNLFICGRLVASINSFASHIGNDLSTVCLCFFVSHSSLLTLRAVVAPPRTPYRGHSFDNFDNLTHGWTDGAAFEARVMNRANSGSSRHLWAKPL